MSTLHTATKSWDYHDTFFNGSDPRFAISQHLREGKPWYVHPRDPFVEGFRCDVAEFFSHKRRLSESPGLLIQYAFLFGAGKGMFKQADIGVQAYSVSRKQENFRLGHQWAMKRLSTLRVIRGGLLWGGLAASYQIPKELFSQNTGRRNRMRTYDPQPHFVGCAGAYLAVGNALGWQMANVTVLRFAVIGAVWLYLEAKGHTMMDAQRNRAYPQMMASIYGLPNKGEGFDLPVGGEMSDQYRMESEVERGVTQTRKIIRQSPLADEFPMFKMDWGHTTYTF